MAMKVLIRLMSPACRPALAAGVLASLLPFAPARADWATGFQLPGWLDGAVNALQHRGRGPGQSTSPGYAPGTERTGG